MASPARELESKALKLPRRDRARLAQRLISSLEQRADADVEKLWLEEAERRLGELKSGKVTGILAAEVMKSALHASVRSIEFHPEAQQEFISGAQFYENPSGSRSQHRRRCPRRLSIGCCAG